jgi:hypothetical protein
MELPSQLDLTDHAGKPFDLSKVIADSGSTSLYTFRGYW